MVDIPRIFNISESAHRIHNPFTPDKYVTLGTALHLEPGARVLDLGSGSGEMLCTWARDHGIIGTGIDMSQLFTEQAKLRAEELGVAPQVKFIHGDAAGYISDEKVDVAACVGATWIAGGISLIAPVGNLVAGMAFALFLIPTAVLMDWAALIPWIPLGPVTGLWLKAAGPVLAFLAHLADLPFSFVRLSATGCMTASAAAVAGILLWRRKRYGLFSGTAIFMVVTVLAAGAQFLGERTSYSDLVISFPEVGQADAAVIRYKGETVLIDCGPPGLPGGDSPLAMALQRMGIRTIDALFLSHMHPDHAGGLRDIMARWPVKRIYIPNNHDARKKLDRYRARGNKASRTESLEHGGEVKTASLVFNILGPDGKKSRPREENRGSLILLLQVDGFQALFTGDAGWDQVLASMAGLHSLDVLKIPHHGSKTGFSPEAMDHAVSAFNDHGPLIAVCPSRPPANRPLPALEVVRWFERSGITLVYTGDNGVNIRYKKSGSKGNGSTVVDKHGLF